MGVPAPVLDRTVADRPAVVAARGELETAPPPDVQAAVARRSSAATANAHHALRRGRPRPTIPGAYVSPDRPL